MGNAKCWGYNGDGELGNGSGEDDSNVPVTVKGVTAATALVTAVGFGYCALLKTGAVKCWGFNGGAPLGDGSTANPAGVPVSVSGLG